MNPDLQAERPQLAVPESQPTSGTINYGLRSPERIPGAELGNSTSQGMPDPAAHVPQAVPTDQPAASGGAVAPAVPGPTTMPATADDTDLIEKEWVIKAKQIVEQTKDDPYRQNNEVHKIKAEYIKKRYNKDIKLVNN